MTRKRMSKAREEEKPTLSPATRQFLRREKKEIRKQRKRERGKTVLTEKVVRKYMR